MSVSWSQLHLRQTARLIFPSVTRWTILFAAVARICMRRPLLLQIIKPPSPRCHPGPSSISYSTLDAGTRPLFSLWSCKVGCRSCGCCHCRVLQSSEVRGHCPSMSSSVAATFCPSSCRFDLARHWCVFVYAIYCMMMIIIMSVLPGRSFTASTGT